MFEGLSCNLFSWQQSKLSLHFCLDLLSSLKALANEQHLTIYAVLCLTEKVGSNEGDITRFVCKYFNFARACRHIDGNIMQADLLLGTHNELIAWTE